MAGLDDGRAAEQELARLDGRDDAAASGEPSTAEARPG